MTKELCCVTQICIFSFLHHEYQSIKMECKGMACNLKWHSVKTRVMLKLRSLWLSVISNLPQYVDKPQKDIPSLEIFSVVKWTLSFWEMGMFVDVVILRDGDFCECSSWFSVNPMEHDSDVEYHVQLYQIYWIFWVCVGGCNMLNQAGMMRFDRNDYKVWQKIKCLWSLTEMFGDDLIITLMGG